jgi:casein kinase II subunit beta
MAMNERSLPVACLGRISIFLYRMPIGTYRGKMAGMSWAEWFCSTDIGRFFVEIEQSYLKDMFNYTGLRQFVPCYAKALECIRGKYVQPHERSKDMSGIDDCAIKLYGLLHARYLLTRPALDLMLTKWKKGDFEKCPRYGCQNSVCLPFGTDEEAGKSKLKLFCPCCHEVYRPDGSIYDEIDGAYFGSNYILLFMQEYGPIVTRRKGQPSLRLFGFKIELDSTESESEEEG